MTIPAQQLKHYCDILLDDESTWEERRQCLQLMHDLFVRLGAFNANDENNRLPHFELKTGAAIAPTWAAMCLFDILRTRQFVSGIRQAIGDMIASKKSQTIQVLDAGCGPYGLLSLLPALYFSAEEVRFTLLDIFPENIRSARRLIDALNMQQYFPELLCTDALQYQWPKEKQLHILITETMNQALRKEPQVAISLHLAPQLAEDGVLIPECIQVSWRCADREKQESLVSADTRNNIAAYTPDAGLIIQLDKNSTIEFISRRPLCTLQLPQYYHPQQYQLELDTHIRVYKNYELKRNETAITLPLIIKRKDKAELSAGGRLDFYYSMNAEPGIGFDYSS